MNKKNLLSLMLMSFIITSCGENKNSVENNSNTETPSTSQNSSDTTSGDYIPIADYILEDGEDATQKINVEYRTLNKLPKSNITIEGIDNLYVDPFTSSIIYDVAVYNYPDENLLSGNNILYTSSWYKQNTPKRNDECIEYVIEPQNGKYKITKINNNHGTFIPFNGAVLSTPNNINKKYNVGDVINVTSGNIPSYDIGFYNQNGYRVAVSTTNNNTWNKTGVNLYDDGYTSYVTPSRFVRPLSLNVAFDTTSNTYKADKFRYTYSNQKIHTNVNDGFMLAADNESNNDNLALIEGVRFNLGDTIYIEDNLKLNDVKYEFYLDKINSYGDNTFRFRKVDDDSSLGNWNFVVGVDKDGYICNTGTSVYRPDGGYRLVIENGANTGSERMFYYSTTIFKRGSKLSIKDNVITIDQNTNTLFESFYKQIVNLYQELMSNYESGYYSYDIKSMDEVFNNLVDIKNEYNDISSSNKDATTNYRLYKLSGKLYHQYFSLLSASNRNEAVMSRGTWYIIDYNTNDSSYENINKNLDYIRSSGINEIILDFYGDGYVNYANSDKFETLNSLKDTYGDYKNDYLKAIINLAHEKGMKVFGNFTPFTCGLEKAFSELNDNFALSIKGQTVVNTSQGRVTMLDPASDEVISKIKETVDDVLANNPGLDGIHLDYIRYGADNNNINTVMGVTEDARIKFNDWCKERNYNTEFNSLEALRLGLQDSTTFSRFNIFEQQLITNTVKEIKDVCLKYKKPLTAAIADNYNQVKTWKCQDWAAWAKDGIIDALYLMDYYFDEGSVENFLIDMITNTNDSCMFVTGIDPSYAGLADEFYPRTIKGAITNTKSQGYAIFGSHTQRAKYDGWELISKSNWINSISPYDTIENIVKTTGDLLLKRCNELYIEYGSQSEDDYNILEADINALYDLLGNEDSATCDALLDKIKTMIPKFYADDDANLRIREQLSYLRKLIKTKKNILG